MVKPINQRFARRGYFISQVVNGFAVLVLGQHLDDHDSFLHGANLPVRPACLALIHEGKTSKGHAAGGGPVLEEQIRYLHRAAVSFDNVRLDLHAETSVGLDEHSLEGSIA